MLYKILLTTLLTQLIWCFDPVVLLRKNGYMQPGYGYSDEAAVISALYEFQQFVGIRQTGVLDQNTLYMMKQPRCGLPDRDGGVSGYGYGKWDRNSLSYHMINHTPDLGEESTHRILREAFDVWEQVTPLRFNNASGRADLNIYFGPRQHASCRFPFDGRGGVLAHAFYPPDGRVHFDDDETFSDKTHRGTNLHWVAAHELGHALGLSHSNVRGSLMFPYYQGYRERFELHYDDIRRIKNLYGKHPGVTTVKPPVTKQPTKRPTTPKCTDYRGSWCSGKAEYCSGVSSDWTDYMEQNCYKTCYCGGVKTTQPPLTTKQFTTRPPVTTQKPACTNQREEKFCNDNKKECSSPPGSSWGKYMRMYCYKTCFCSTTTTTTKATLPPTTPPVCKNERSEKFCEEYKNECSSPPDDIWGKYMRKYCYKTCFCNASPANTRTPVTIPPPTSKPRACTNKYTDSFCKSVKYGCQYTSKAWVEYMNKYCYKTCHC